ncbi:Carboxy-terminal processing protease CtpB precursor [compost metagenome]
MKPPELYTVARLSLTETLKLDMLGEKVKSVQIMLRGLGYEISREDGYFDEMTEQAVTQFQTKQGLTATGEVDSKTAEKLELAVIKWIQDEQNDKQLNEAIKAVGRKY